MGRGGAREKHWAGLGPGTRILNLMTEGKQNAFAYLGE